MKETLESMAVLVGLTVVMTVINEIAGYALIEEIEYGSHRIKSKSKRS